MSDEATLLLRLDGPLQAWGTGSKWRIRQTNREPSFSGVVGMICAALGWKRDHPLDAFQDVTMAVRADREGYPIHDYHTVGAPGRPPVPERFQGNLTAGGKVKVTQSTGEIETLVSERYYLADAVFTVALTGPRTLLETCRDALARPKFPLYLGRKACPCSVPPLEPGEPLVDCADPETALRDHPWRPRINAREEAPPERIRFVVPAQAGDQFAERRADVPHSFARRQFGVRYVQHTFVDMADIEAGGSLFAPPGKVNRFHNPRTKTWERNREESLDRFNHRCVFTGLPAEHVHHVTYERANNERVEHDLRPLSKLAHDAITMLEAEAGMRRDRLDPLPPEGDSSSYAALERQMLRKMEDIIEHHDLSAAEHLKQKIERLDRKERSTHA